MSRFRPAGSDSASPAPAILLVVADSDDRTLATLLVERELPQATVTVAGDLAAFDLALADGTADVAVCAANLAFANLRETVAMVKRRSPRTAIVLVGGEAEILQAVSPGLACDGLIRATTAGFLALPRILREVLERRGPRVEPEAAGTDTDSEEPAEPAGQDMRDVALVVSHDVREPVHQIVRLARRAQASPERQQTDQALAQVLECAERAGSMLDRMVDYLTVTGGPATRGPVDLNACLNLALANLRSSIDEVSAEVRAVFLPTSVGDEQQIVHLFQNLLSNAIKFRGRERPVVTISVEPRGAQWLLAFRDNGVGIPPAFSERMFELGKRLHTRDEYPGSGIGLALCKRIVERHGGRIWGEPAPGGGSTFYVLLPRASADVARLA